MNDDTYMIQVMKDRVILISNSHIHQLCRISSLILAELSSLSQTKKIYISHDVRGA